jgi:hypothetical protein
VGDYCYVVWTPETSIARCKNKPAIFYARQLVPRCRSIFGVKLLEMRTCVVMPARTDFRETRGIQHPANSTTRVRNLQWIGAIAIAALILSGALAVSAQQGPLPPKQTPNVVRIPTNPQPDQAPIPPDEIIRRFAAQEDTYARAVGNYTYRRTVRLEEIGPDNKVSGQSEVVSEIVVSEDGTRRQRQISRSDSTLHVFELEPDALEVLGRIPTFPFGQGQVANYNFLYQTSEPVDDLNTYVFRVTPRQLSRTQAYFSGLIWVDDHDLAVVKSFGKWVTELGDLTMPNLPFNMFETLRQPVSNKYWMPAYARSDSSVSQNGANVPVRIVVLWDQYTPIVAGKTSAVPETPAHSNP